jgi:hypothetical protein
MLKSVKMWTSRIASVLFVLLTLSSALAAQDKGIAFVSGPEFKLSDKAAAAGIDGTLTVLVKVDRAGNVKKVDILAGPIWPCDSTPSAAIKDVREAVKKNILASKFSPAIKNGKPVDAEAKLDFAIGVAYNEAVKGKQRGESRWVVDVASLGEKALRLPPPVNMGISGVVSVRVLIGESGNVISAGAVGGHPALRRSARMAACDSRFPPIIVDGKPIKVTGLITYEFSRGFTRVR